MKSKILLATNCVALCACLSMGLGCAKKEPAATPQSNAVSADTMKQMIEVVSSSKNATAFGADLKETVAERLGNLGQQAKDAGAIPALTKLSKNGKASKEARAAAVAALAKLNGGAAPAP